MLGRTLLTTGTALAPPTLDRTGLGSDAVPAQCGSRLDGSGGGLRRSRLHCPTSMDRGKPATGLASTGGSAPWPPSPNARGMTDRQHAGNADERARLGRLGRRRRGAGAGARDRMDAAGRPGQVRRPAPRSRGVGLGWRSRTGLTAYPGSGCVAVDGESVAPDVHQTNAGRFAARPGSSARLSQP